MLLLSAITAHADPGPDNPGNHWGKENNPGNHYGQISNPGNHYAYGRYKHLPTPPPSPAPIPTPTSNPGTEPSGGPATSQGGGAAGPVTSNAGGTWTLPDLSGFLPGPVDRVPQAQVIESPGAGELGWLVLAILPLLFALWVMVATRLIVNARRRQRSLRPAPARRTALQEKRAT
jgi:hypothetical protein